jgi:hypothetical protein
MRALANDGQPRFRLPCAEVLLPSCASPVAAPRLRRQIRAQGSRREHSGCHRQCPQRGERPQVLPLRHRGLAAFRMGVELFVPKTHFPISAEEPTCVFPPRTVLLIGK